MKKYTGPPPGIQPWASQPRPCPGACAQPLEGSDPGPSLCVDVRVLSLTTLGLQGPCRASGSGQPPLTWPRVKTITADEPLGARLWNPSRECGENSTVRRKELEALHDGRQLCTGSCCQGAMTPQEEVGPPCPGLLGSVSRPAPRDRRSVPATMPSSQLPHHQNQVSW